MKKVKTVMLLLAIVLNSTTAHSQWSLTGNAGTTPPTNFLGTTDQQPLVIKVNNLFSGLIDYDVNKANTTFGHQSLISLSTGTYNSAFGFYALNSNTTGGANTASGMQSLQLNGTGWNNTASGAFSLANNISGSSNTAIGASSLYLNTSGDNNTACGYRALTFNTSGGLNTASGFYSLYANETGYYNSAIGAHAPHSNIDGSGNTGLGYSALYSNTSGSANTASGIYSLYSNTAGYNNTANGYYSLNQNTTGTGNSSLGWASCGSNTTGSDNSAFGSASLAGNTTGYGNTGAGFYALYSNITGLYNTGIGCNADVNSSNYSNSTAIGYNATISASNQVRVGNASVTSIGGYANWTNLSDGRVKKNIQTNVPGLTFINKLTPVTYTLDLAEIDNILRLKEMKDKDGKSKQYSKEEVETRRKKEQIIYTGFIAQDVEATAKSINYEFSGVDAPKNEKDPYGLRYAEFVVPLVKAVQELSIQNEAMKKELSELRALVKGDTNKSTDAVVKSAVSKASLFQNTPNPFNNVTRIRYYLPSGSTNSKLTITSSDGKILKVISLQNNDKSGVIISSGELMPGIYFYSLTVGGEKVDTKQMVITK